MQEIVENHTHKSGKCKKLLKTIPVNPESIMKKVPYRMAQPRTTDKLSYPPPQGKLSYAGRGILVLFVVRGRAIFKGYFFQTVTELWVSFSQFLDISQFLETLFRELWVPFSGDF